MKNTTAILLLLLSFALFYTTTLSYYDKAKVLRASSQDYQGVLDNILRIAETRDQLLVDYRGIPKAEIERLGKVLPDHVDTVKMAQELDTISSHYGISLKNIRIDKAASQDASLPILPEFEKPYNKVTLSFSFIANYADFRKFLEDLEKSLRIMDIRSLIFQAGESAISEYQISIDTYWLKGEQLADDVTLVKTVDELSNINFDRNLFTTPSYRSLTDFSAAISQEATGRPNPFDIIGRD